MCPLQVDVSLFDCDNTKQEKQCLRQLQVRYPSQFCFGSQYEELFFKEGQIKHFVPFFEEKLFHWHFLWSCLTQTQWRNVETRCRWSWSEPQQKESHRTRPRTRPCHILPVAGFGKQMMLHLQLPASNCTQILQTTGVVSPWVSDRWEQTTPVAPCATNRKLVCHNPCWQEF